MAKLTASVRDVRRLNQQVVLQQIHLHRQLVAWRSASLAA